MVESTETVFTRAADCRRESMDDPVKGQVTWYALIDRAVTATAGLMAGIAEVEPGQGAKVPHRHLQPELYYILDGVGELTIDGILTTVAAGTAVFIPSNAWHQLRNGSSDMLRLLYVLPADGIANVDYQYE